MLSPDTADEYVSAFEAQEDVDGEPATDVPAEQVVQQMTHASEILELQTRVAELQSLLEVQQAGQVRATAAEASGGRGQVPGIFEAGGQTSLTTADIERLQRAAGPPPRRLGRAEAIAPGPSSAAVLANQALGAEDDRGVIDLDSEEQNLAAEIAASVQTTADPMQKLMLLQLRQTTELMRTLAGKQAQQDPLSAMLSASDSGSGSSGSQSKVWLQGRCSSSNFRTTRRSWTSSGPMLGPS